MTRARWSLAAPGLALALGCAGSGARVAAPAPPVARAQAAEPVAAPAACPAPAPAAPQALPVSLDAVLRLAEGQNLQLAAARERVQQAYAEQELAAKGWLPEIHVGAGYYRHEGGIQEQDGRLIRSSTGAVIAGLDLAARIDPRAAAFAELDAARRALQQKGELRRLTHEVLLDAANTYIDLLAAHSGLAVARSLEADLHGLLERARRLANLEPGARVE